MRHATVIAVLLSIAAIAFGDWPMLHNDLQRSGYTDEVVAGPYERKWFRDFHDEMIATRVEAIVAEGKAFIPTMAGNLHALDVKTGETVWTFEADGPIGASPCYRDGKVYFGADEGFNRGGLYCINAATGKQVWRYEAGAGIWVSPTTDGKKVYFGDRAGLFHAVDLTSGKKAWTVPTEYVILTPASISADGERIVFASEDMHVYCVSADGKTLWTSEKVGGLSLRDHAPTIWQGLVIVRTNPAREFHNAFGMHGGAFKQFHQSLPMDADDKVTFDKWGRYTMQWTERRAAAERKFITDYLDSNKAEKTFYAFNLSDGKEPWTAPVTYFGGLHNPTTPPTFNPKTGVLYTWGGTSLDSYSAGVPGGGIGVMTLDAKTGQTKIIPPPKSRFGQPADETQALSLMGDILLNTHQGSILGMEMNNDRKEHTIISQRDSYGGIIGVLYNRTQSPAKGFYTGTYTRHRDGWLTSMANEWHGPDRSIAAISDGRLFWIAGSQVVCVGGPRAQKTASGGASPPRPIKHRLDFVAPGCNLAVAWEGTYDESVPRIEVPVAKIKAIVDAMPAAGKQADDELSKEVRARLDAAVSELVGGKWAPMMVEIGISAECPEFWRAGQAMQIVALSLPHLSPDVRTQAVAWLDELFDNGYPLVKVKFDMKQGERREPFEVGPAMGGKYTFTGLYGKVRPGIENLYAVWAYAQYADRWDKVLAKRSLIEATYKDFASRPFKFDHPGNEITPEGDMKFIGGNAAETLNAQMAGLVGYIRIMGKAGQSAPANAALGKLAELAVERVHHERADTCFVRMDDFGNHSARVPRYLELTPETGAILRAFAGEKLHANLAGLTTQLPVWHHAYGERLIGGENYINPAHLARALFAGLAYGDDAPADKLVKYVDQPWGKADLYYIEKLSATLRAAAQK